MPPFNINLNIFIICKTIKIKTLTKRIIKTPTKQTNKNTHKGNNKNKIKDIT